MTTLSMSTAEILRVGVWSLRALGFPFGTAERAIRFLAWAEAVQGGGLRLLRIAEDEIAASAKLATAMRARNDAGDWIVTSGGKHLLEIGAPAIDLACADARSRGFGRAVLHGALGAWLLPALCDLAVRRGLAIVAVYRAGAREILPANFAAGGWIAGIGVGGEPHFFAGSIEALRTTRHRIDERVARAAIADSESGAGHIGISVWTGSPDLQWPGDLPVADYPDRLIKAYREGVPVDTADCAHLYDLEKRTWAPTSERSRGQAGFGKYGDAKS